MLIIEFVRNWKARRDYSGVSSHPVTSACELTTPPDSQAMLLEERPLQSSPTIVRERGPGSIEMQEFPTSEVSTEKRQNMFDSKAAKAAVLAIGKKGKRGKKDAAKMLISED